MIRFVEAVSEVVGGSHVLSRANSRIALRVLRLKRGDRVHILDGQGATYITDITSQRDGAVFTRILDVRHASRPLPRLTLLQALPKGEKAEFIIQKAVEFGVDELRFVSTDHTIARPKKEKADRWRQIVEEAMRQSGNPFGVDVAPPTSFSKILTEEQSTLSIVLDEQRHGRPLGELVSDSRELAHVRLAVGPEGGWSDSERQLMEVKGFVSACLGPYILRAETASVGAMAVVRGAF